MIRIQLQGPVQFTHHLRKSEHRRWGFFPIDARSLPKAAEERKMGIGELAVERHRSFGELLTLLEMNQPGGAFLGPPAKIAFLLRLCAQLPARFLSPCDSEIQAQGRKHHHHDPSY